MALIECHECGKTMSNQARTCPHCGAKRKSKIVKLFLLLLLTGFIFLEFLSMQEGFDPAIRNRQEAARLAAMTPEERAAEEKKIAAKKQAEEDWRDSWNAIYDCRDQIEKRLNDPDSVKYENEVHSTPFAKGKDGTFTITLGLRAKNAFGAMMPAVFICEAKKNGEEWNITKIVQLPVN